ncbi:hypothetical protein AK812_SmicGene4036 [Symbiodinium microadriaticum]|uniref:Integrase catalytic domain-containing protein n=1 Tax=Symbiodinium microadriaticum TaxID=2951 RepID=A0A1Q9EXA2_SYMMI|nr:hypothetical protein AK812_SmicGene4036 [Symbiodinium microadriaticum]
MGPTAVSTVIIGTTIIFVVIIITVLMITGRSIITIPISICVAIFPPELQPKRPEPNENNLMPVVSKEARDVECFESLGRVRAESRKIFAWLQDVVLSLRSRGVIVVAEHPLRSRAWKEPLVVDAFAGLPAGITDMCAYGLRRPDAEWDSQACGRHLRRPTRVVGPLEVVTMTCRRCPGGHRHAPELGGVLVDGTWCRLGDFVGCYTDGFAKAVSQGVTKALKGTRKNRGGEGFYVTPKVAEESLMEEDEDVIHGAYFDEQLVLEPLGPEGLPENQNHNNHDTDNHGTEGLERFEIEAGTCEFPAEDPDQAEKDAFMRELDSIPLEDQNHNNHGTDNHEAPKRPLPARPEVRAVVFNTAVHADLKYLRDFRGVVYVALSVIDEATNYHLAKLLRNREPGHVAAKFLSMWVGLFGPPQRIRLDQGGEWESEFIQLLENHAIHSEFVGSHSPWSNGFAERHGALLGVAMQANVDEKQLAGRAQMKIGLSCACQAKNSVISRGGHSAHYLVFGRQAAYPELLDDEVWSRKSMGFALSIEGEVSRAAELRAAAKVALLRGDVLEKIRRALRRAPAGERRQYVPGELVYFWSPAKPKDRRYKRDLGAWRGPAVVLMPEGAERYFISWRGRCLLVSGANLKGATVEESNKHDLRAEGLDLELAKGFIDCTDDAPPLEEPLAPFSVEGPDLVRQRRPQPGARKLTEARKMMAGLKSVKKTLRGPIDKRRRRQLLPVRFRPQRLPREEQGEEQVVSDTAVDADQEAAPSNAQDEPPLPPPAAQQPWQDAPPVPDAPPAVPYDYLDDVPFSIRKRLREQAGQEEGESRAPDTKKLRTGDFANFVLTALSLQELSGSTEKANEWLPKAEVEKLSALLDLPLSSARVHRAPGKRLQHPGPRRKKPRITVMFSDGSSGCGGDGRAGGGTAQQKVPSPLERD